MMDCWPHGCNWSNREKYIDNSGGGWGSCEDRMSTDSQKALKRRTHFDELEALLEERNLECEESSLDCIEEPAPSVAKKPTCHSEQDCNRTEDTYWLLHSFQRGPSEKIHRK